MKRTQIIAALAAAALGGCQTTVTGAPPAAGTQARVEQNTDVSQLLRNLRSRGISVSAADVSRTESLSDAPGYAYRVGPEWLHLHAYASAAAAAAARERFVAGNPTTMVSWVGKPHLFQCGTAVALYLGVQAAPIAALTEMCGAPAFPR